MSRRVTTIKDVRGMFERCASSAFRAGVENSRWALIEGSKVYGNAFKLVEVDPTSGGQSMILHLGYTRTEAYDGLHAMSVAFELAAK